MDALLQKQFEAGRPLWDVTVLTLAPGAVWVESPGGPGRQQLTLVHFSAQRKRFPWDRGCI